MAFGWIRALNDPAIGSRLWLRPGHSLRMIRIDPILHLVIGLAVPGVKTRGQIVLSFRNIEFRKLVAGSFFADYLKRPDSPLTTL